MSGIQDYSKIPADNNLPPPNGWPEGQAPSTVNNCARQNMADLRTWYETSQWVNYGYAPTYASATSFTLPSGTDYTALFQTGKRIKAQGLTTGTIYGTILTSSHSGVTTVVVSWDSGILQDETLVVSLAALSAINDSLPYLNKQSADVASSSTINLNQVRGDLVDVTGTTTITAITLAQGQERTVRFTGILTLTNGASLVLPSGANITTAAGDFAIFRGYASSVVRCVGYFRATGAPLTPSSSFVNVAVAGKFSTTSAGTLTIATGEITVTGSNHLVDTEGAATTDDLDTVNGLVDGQELTLKIVDASRNVIIKHNTGNIYNPSGVDLALDVTTDTVILKYDSGLSKAVVVSAKSLAPIFIAQDQKTTGTNGGGSNSGYNTRVLNTSVVNTISGASLASNQITLPAGSYKIYAEAPAFASDGHKLRLANVTDSTYVYGSSERLAVPSGVVSYSRLTTQLTISVGKVFELQHYFQTSAATDGLGVAVNSGETEIYTTIKIEKIA